MTQFTIFELFLRKNKKCEKILNHLGHFRKLKTLNLKILEFAIKIFFREGSIKIDIKILDPWVFRFCSKVVLSKMSHTLDFR